MKKKVTIQHIYILFLTINITMLIAGAFWVKPNRINLGESTEYTEITPINYERTDDGKRQYTLNVTSDGLNSYLMFYTKHQEIWLYADDKLIYSQTRVNTIFGHSVGSIWNLVSFPSDTKEIVIAFKAVYSSGEKQEFTFYQGNGVAMLRQMIHASLLSMGICASIIMLGIFMIIYWLLVCRKTKVAQDMLYMGIFVSLLGMWSLGEETGIAVLFNNRPYASFLAYTLLMLMGISFLLFVKFFLGAEDRYIHKILVAYSFTAMIVSIVLQCLNIADFKQTVILSHICLVCGLLYLLFVVCDKLRKRKGIRRVRLNLIGLLVLASATGIELFAYYKQIQGLQAFGVLGFLIYIIILGMEVSASASDTISEGHKAEIYKELAEKDILTKCYNRNAYNEDIKQKISDDSTYLVMFDLNNLKKCNDILGHIEGDRYLTDSANLIQKIFGRYGKVYRIGGDEFCIIMKNTSEDKISSLIQQLVQEEAAYNKQSQTVHMQIASGYARYDAAQDSDLDQTRCRADVLMYENKKQLKAAENL